MPQKKTVKEKSPLKKTEKAKWIYQGKEDFEVPSSAVGFVYLIKVKDTPYYYCAVSRV